MKNILPPPTLPVLPESGVVYSESGVNATYNNIMLDLAQGKYLTRMAMDFDLPRPVILFGDDDLWRAVVKVLAFNHRHTREAVRQVMGLLIKPRISEATILDREYVRNIAIGNTLDVQSGPNVGQYTIVGVTPHELIFNSGTFGTTPDAGPITYEVGSGAAPITGPTLGTHGRIYTADDGTERFRDATLSFVNTHTEDLLTQVNKLFPQYGEVIFDKNSPIEEVRKMGFYDALQSGLMILSQYTESNLTYTHPKYLPIQSSVLAVPVDAQGLTLTVENATPFPSNLGPVDALLVGDTISILQGPNVGTYAITAISDHQITINTGVGALTVTGKDANNNYKITPAAVPAGSKGTIFGGGGVTSTFVVGPTNFATFRDDDVLFTTTVDPHLTGSTGYSVRINRGEITEEVIQVRSLAGNVLTLALDPDDPTNQKSLLKFAHQANESVEIEGLEYSANATYFKSLGTATGGGLATVVDATNPFVATLVNSADIEMLSGPSAGERRAITNVVGPNTAQVNPDFSNPIGAGDTYRVIKRYIAGTDNILYLDDTTGLPHSNFTVIVDRGTSQEEVLYIGTNDVSTTPNTLTILNSDAGTAFCAKNHSSSFSVEAAQVLIPGCEWDIIETQATGEYTIASKIDCLPDIGLESFFLHAPVDLTKLGVGAAALTAAITAGDASFQVALTGANSYATCLENVGDRDGILCRTLKFDDGAGTVEEVFATKQQNYTTLKSFIDAGSTVLPVRDAGEFDGLYGATIVIGRNTASSETRTIGALGSIDLVNNTITITVATGARHNIGASIELANPTVLISNVFQNNFPLPAGADISLLYLDTIYRLEDPIVPGTYSATPNGNLIEPVPNKSYLPLTTTQPKKAIFPGSYTYLVDDNPIADQISQARTSLASGPDFVDLTASFRIPLTQTLVGADNGAGLTLGAPVGAGTSQIIVADGRLFPTAIQNPFFVAVDHNRPNEEVINCVGIVAVADPGILAIYPHAYAIQVDPTYVFAFSHNSKTVTTNQTFPIGTVDLQVSKLVVSNGSGFGASGGIFLDYGFNHNQKVLYPVKLSGTTAAVANGISDATKLFTTYYANPDALEGGTIIVNPATPGTRQVRKITAVLSPTQLQASLNWAPAIGAVPYEIYAVVEVDDSEVGTNLKHSGGVITSLGSVYPAREGGITQEYVKFSSTTQGSGSNLILHLATPTVFKKGHPSGTEVIVGTGTVAPLTDGSSYQPFLYTDFLTALFHKYGANFGSLIKAAGIEIKAEDV